MNLGTVLRGGTDRRSGRLPRRRGGQRDTGCDAPTAAGMPLLCSEYRRGSSEQEPQQLLLSQHDLVFGLDRKPSSHSYTAVTFSMLHRCLQPSCMQAVPAATTQSKQSLVSGFSPPSPSPSHGVHHPWGPLPAPSPPAHHVQACLCGREYFSMMAVSRSREHFWSRLSCAEDWRLISSEAEFRLGRWEFWKLCQRSFLQGRRALERLSVAPAALGTVWAHRWPG